MLRFDPFQSFTYADFKTFLTQVDLVCEISSFHLTFYEEPFAYHQNSCEDTFSVLMIFLSQFLIQ